MGAIPFWGDDPDWWDEITIGTEKFKETNVDIDGTITGDLDVPKAAQNDGAPSNYKGYVPCTPKVTVLLYTREHWESYLRLVDLIQPRPGKTVPAIVSVIYPTLQIYKKEKFQLEKLPFLKHLAPNQKSVTFELVEYFPAAKKTPTGKSGFTEGYAAENGAGVQAKGQRASGVVIIPEEQKPSKTSTKP